MTSPRTERARALRAGANEAESLLWSHLRDRRLNGFKFVSEWPINRYFADFACRSEKLVVEIDGSHHADQRSYDDERDIVLNRQGRSVARFWHADVLRNLDSVLNMIVGILEKRITDAETNAEWRFSPVGRG